jgi:HlyD family secretion protein
MENPKAQIPNPKSQGRSKSQGRKSNVFTWDLGFGFWVLGFTAALAAAGCAQEAAPDAYGNVEATEVVISPEAAGRLTRLSVEEGQTLAAGAVVGEVDSTPLVLQRNQLTAQHAGTVSRVGEVDKQMQALAAQRDAAQAQREASIAQRGALQSQLEIARRAHERTERLFAKQAATAQQLDQAERDDRVLQDQIKAQEQQIEAQGRQVAAQTAQIAAAQAQRQSALAQVSSADAQVAQVEDRIRRSTVTNPSAGTVLVTYAHAGEMVQPGQPLYKIANLDAVDVRAYITEPQLASVRVGQQARITVDAGDTRKTLTGTVSWVAAQAEFTPTPIQTRDERADLVYAIMFRVPNQVGVLKIGMPVDVELTQ